MVWDSTTSGLLVEVMSSGKKIFRLYYRFDGKVRYYTLGHYGSITVAAARAAAVDKMSSVVKGIDPLHEKREAAKQAKVDNAIRLRTFFEQHYKPWVRANRKAAEATIYTVEKYFNWLMDKRMDEITQWQITKWQTEQRKRGIKASTVNRILVSLRGVLSKAVEWDILVVSPLSKVKDLKHVEDARIRYLTAEEEHRLLNALRARHAEGVEGRNSANEWRAARGYDLLPVIEGYFDYLEPFVLVALNTGMRRGELFSLKWKDVNFSTLNITIAAENAKSSKTRHIPMNKTVENVLNRWSEQHKAVPTGFVFPNPDTGHQFTTIKTAWNRLLKRAEIKDFRFHDCRHSFASKLVMRGIDLNTVRELLGHSDLQTTLRYAHLAPEHKAQAVAILEG